MRIIFTPTESERREYDLDEVRLMTTETGVIESLTGWSWGYKGIEYLQRVMGGSTTAQRALLFVLEKRTHPTLVFKDFDYPADAVEVALGRSDFDRIKELIDDPNQPIPADQRAELRAQLEEAAESFGEDSAPKEQAKASSSDGSAI